MKSSNNEETQSIDSIRALFGPPPPRRPIPSHSFSTLVKIFSLFPDQNPFSDYASYANLPECPRWYGGNQNNQNEPKSGDGHDDSVVERDKNKASGELIGPAIVELCNSPPQIEASNDITREEFCINDSSSGLDMVIDELCKMTNNTETMDKMASDEEHTDVQMAEVPEVPETLSGIEKILMDDSDDMGLLGLPEKDVNFTFLNDFGSILDTDVCIDNTVAAESSQIRNLSTEGNMKENVVGVVKGKDVEVNTLIPGGHTTKSQGSLLVDREISNNEEAKSQQTTTRLVYSRNKEKKLCKEKDTNKLVESSGLTFATHKAKDGGRIVSSGDSVNSVGKGNKSDTATKGKLQTATKASLKDVNLGQQKHISVNGEAPNSTRSGSADLLIHGKKNAREIIGKSSTTKVRKSQPESSKGFRYTREKLLCLRNTTSVSEDMLKAVQEIGADLHNKGQHSTGGKTMDISGANKESQGSPTKTKLAKENEKDSSILKNKKRGSSSEARKEKKKRLKRKKRVEMNKKLGVKRLKLRPILKPKVVPDCRHYLQGRCQQGEQCKFSHDLIPLTKSKPCCHFARNACMKGDDCPFDHQLSKYPCKNYVDTGFCIRGDSCLFSHKVSATDGSTTVSGVSKCETNSVLQPDESNSKHQLNAGFATPNSLKGDSARPISLPAMAPKGLSFLSFGKSSAENSAKHKEAEQSQQSSGDAAGTRTSPNIVTETASKINDDGSGRGSQLNQGISSKPVNVCQMFKGNVAPISPKTNDLSSCSRPSYVDSGDKSQATVPINEHPNCQLSKKGTADESDKLKAVVQPNSPASSGQCLANVGRARSTQSTAQRALLSTLAFAAKFESGIKMTSVAPSKEVSKNGGTTSDSGSRHNEESKASAILDFLYSGNNK